VRRGRRLPLEDLASYLLDVPALATKLDWNAVFGNDHPVEVEIGCGKGLFLVNAGQACPGVNFVGIEILRKYQLFCAGRLAKRGLRNVRLVKADARSFLRDCVPADSLQALHIYFPDPWWKNRHHKRRLFTPEFAADCERVLRGGGRLHVVTDVEEYFGVITELLARRTGLSAVPPPDSRNPEHDLDYLTNFERKFRKQGRPIFRGLHEKDELAPGIRTCDPGASSS
jgi:tRNA (guanine-N7-)-methyltransferase